MSTEKLDTETRQEQIAQAALDLVAGRGIRGLNISAVARRIGVVPSAIYRHFKGKDDVLDAVLDLISTRLLSNIAAARKTSDTLECLRLLLMLHVQMIRENEAIPRVVFSDEVYGGHSGRKAKMNMILQKYIGEVTIIVQEGQQRGQIRSGLNAETLALMFLGIIQPAAIIWHLSEEKFDVTKHAERAWNIFRETIMMR